MLMMFYHWFILSLSLVIGLSLRSILYGKRSLNDVILNLKNIFIFSKDVLFGSPESIREENYKGKSYTWFKYYAEKVGMALNPFPEFINRILTGLEKKRQLYGEQYCPCSTQRIPDTICPCKLMRENKYCHCGLFVLPETPVVEPIENSPYKRYELPGYLDDGQPVTIKEPVETPVEDNS